MASASCKKTKAAFETARLSRATEFGWTHSPLLEFFLCAVSVAAEHTSEDTFLPRDSSKDSADNVTIASK